MNQDWQSRKLGEICRFINGRAYSKNELLRSGKYPVLRVGNFFTNNEWYYSDLELDEEKYCDSGDLLYAWSASFGPQMWNGGKVIYHYHIWKLIPNFSLVDKDFLYLLLVWDTEAIKSAHGTGTTMMHVGKGSIENRIVPLPPLPEQKRIVAILDECFAAIAKAKANVEQNLKNAKELFESYLQGVFENKGDGWENKQLKDVAIVFGRGKSKHRPRNWGGLYGGDYPFVQTGQVRNANKYVLDYTQTYNEVGLKQSKLWRKGTIAITIAANIAETAILGFDACFPDSIIGLQVNPKKADLDFTYYLLQYFKSELQKLGKGSAQDNINLGTFENQFFPFPKDVSEQHSIVRKLDALRAETTKLETIYRKKIEDLEELKKSILQRAFEGGL
ncbi:MAG: restriction endonuclease subunit S [Ignavibacteria bacterium]|nr:restriction endonuclease subunit S [Ignavibacteria bacterium]